MNLKKILISLHVALIATLGLVSCERLRDPDPIKLDYVETSGTIVQEWNKFFLDCNDHMPGFRPPIAARALAYMNIIRYEAMAPAFKTHQSMAYLWPSVKLPTFDKSLEYHWGVVLNSASKFAARSFLVTMTRNDFLRSDSLFNIYDQKFKTECDSVVYKRSYEHAFKTFEAIYAFSIEDGQTNAFINNKPRDYIAPVGPGLWRSTPPDNLLALTPRWGATRPFAIRESDRIMKDPIKFSEDVNSEFYKQAKEVYDAVQNKTPTSVWIAEYWSDDASTFTIDAGSRQLSILNQILKIEKESIENSIVLTTKLGLSLHDASVACWYNKYKYNVLRPYSYIYDNMDKSWKTLLRDPTKEMGAREGITPQHPSYPSGHSTYAQAAAEIFIAEWGDKYKFTDMVPEGKKDFYDMRPRSFTSFTQMAEENAFSRIPLGVHYRMDCVEGLALGKKVGQRINSLNWKKPAL
jgi:hypothetical protein